MSASPERRSLPSLALTALLGFLAAAACWGSTPPGSLDATLAAPLTSLTEASGLWLGVVWLGGEPGALVVLLLSLAPYLVRAACAPQPLVRIVGAGVVAGLLGLVAAWSVEDLWKPFLGREINGGLAFPSGHTTAVTCCALLAWWGVRTFSALLRRSVRLLALLLVVSQGLALVALSYHYPTDVLGGLLWGGFLALLAVLALERLVPPRDEAAASLRRPRERGTQLAGVLARESLR